MLRGGAEAWSTLSQPGMRWDAGGISPPRAVILTDGLDFWEDLSRTSSKDRSESSEKLRFWLAFKSGKDSRGY